MFKLFWRKNMSEFEQSVVIPLRETLVSKLGFVFDPDDDPNGVFKWVRNENYTLVFYYSIEEEEIYLGFWHGNDRQFSSTQKSRFSKIWEQTEFKEDFSDLLTDWGEQWIIKNLKCKGWDINRLMEYIVFRFQLLEFAVNLLKID
jgi:hypothetical protein